jgi:hypothetical protein
MTAALVLAIDDMTERMFVHIKNIVDKLNDKSDLIDILPTSKRE